MRKSGISSFVNRGLWEMGYDDGLHGRDIQHWSNESYKNGYAAGRHKKLQKQNSFWNKLKRFFS